MKKFILISLLCLAFQMQSLGSHILGAEITYEHIKDYKYKAFITVYRDCKECKIAGEGGGSNTKDCGQFFLYLKSSSRNGCTSNYIGKFGLTRESIQTILPLCPSAISKCTNDSGLNFGVEAHTFSTEIDFDDYKSYENCGFDMYVQIATRADDIDNLSQSSHGETLYNYSYIDPFEQHSSPTFSDNPEILLTVNQASRSLVMNDITGDSISIHFAKPLRGANNEIDYQSGYFLNRPLSVWCNGDVTNCEANPNAQPPIGVTLNERNGSLAFTPIKNNEKATLVFEVEKFKKTSSGMQLISVVRRDILVEVTSMGQHNNPPQLFGTSLDKSSNEVEACVGSEICFEVQAQDLPYIFPDGTYQTANTVTYEWLSQLENATIKQVGIAQAPYNKLQICWTPKAEDAGKTFALSIKATDNNCPLEASSSNKYYVKVNALPNNRLRLKDLWCGSIGLESDSAQTKEGYSVTWDLATDNGEKTFSSNQSADTIQFDAPFKGVLTATLKHDNGCSQIIQTEIEKTESDLTRSFGEFIGKTNYCAGDTAFLHIKPSQNVTLSEVVWVHNLQPKSYTEKYSFVAAYQETQDSIDVYLKGNRGKLFCRNVLHKEIIVEKGLDVTIPPVAPICEGSSGLNLQGIPSTSGGTWSGINHNLLESSVLIIGKLGDIQTPTEICQEYITTSIASGCISRDTMCLYVVPNPSLELNKTVICGASGYFNLINMDPSLFSFGDHNIIWQIDGMTKTDNPQGNSHLIDLTKLTKGDHEIIGTITNEFGCISSDTGTLSLLDNVDLSHVTDQRICQGDLRDLNKIFDINLVGGYWIAPENQGAVLGNIINPEVCENLSLNFTYDQYGCYVNQDVKLEIVCKPEVDFDMHDTVCALESEIPLKASPSQGSFIGYGIANNTLFVDSENKTYDFIYRINKDQCEFEYPQNITVVPVPTMQVGNGIPGAICEGQRLELNPLNVENGILDISYSTGDTSLTGGLNKFILNPNSTEIQQGKMHFDLHLVGVGHCPIDKESYQVDIHQKAKIQLLDSQFVGCAPYSFKPRFKFNAELVDWSKTQTEWDFGGGQKPSYKLEPSNTYKTPGVYSVSLNTISAQGCVFNKTWLNAVEVHESPNASFTSYPSGTISVANPIVKFYNNSVAQDSLVYTWNFGTGIPADISSEESPVFNFGLDTGTFTVELTATTLNGCDDVHSEKIRVLPDIQIFVPTAFSPNGKGSEITEEFKVVGTNVSNYHIEIFNRWGEQVYASNNIMEEWDGKVSGRYCQVGIYAYLIQATSTSGKTYELKGTINVVR